MIKECPFCGGEAELHANYNWKLKLWFVYVQCEVCGSRGKSFTNIRYLEPDDDGFWETKKAVCAVEAWNRRKGS